MSLDLDRLGCRWRKVQEVDTTYQYERQDPSFVAGNAPLALTDTEATKP